MHPKQANQLRGKKAQSLGKQFEEIFDLTCRARGIQSIVIPQGGQWHRGKVILVKSPFDRVVINREGRVAFLDLKTFGSARTLSRSMLTDHQVDELFETTQRKQTGGYLVYYRDADKIVFYGARALMEVLVSRRPGLRIDEGVQMGALGAFDLAPLFLGRVES